MIYIQTNDPSKVIGIRPGDDMASVVNADKVPSHEFNLTNTLKASTMRLLRQEAQASGLTLKNVKRVAIR